MRKGGKILMEIEYYSTNSNHCQIKDFIDGLPDIEQAQVYAAFRQIETSGIHKLETRQIEGKIWELKTYRHNRFFYFIQRGNTMIILYAMKKQKHKLEKKDKERILAIYDRLK
jgi:phage-related protein